MHPPAEKGKELCSFLVGNLKANDLLIVVMAYGVIGNTTGFGPVILGSSPSRPTELERPIAKAMGFFMKYDRVGKFKWIGAKVNPKRPTTKLQRILRHFLLFIGVLITKELSYICSTQVKYEVFMRGL